MKFHTRVERLEEAEEVEVINYSAKLRAVAALSLEEWVEMFNKPVRATADYDEEQVMRSRQCFFQVVKKIAEVGHV